MYNPRSYAEHRPDVIFDFIEEHPFGALVTMNADGLIATHMPFLLDRERGEHGALQGHIARANGQYRGSVGESDALVIFAGADAYITPSWYPAKVEHGKVVPTWNYIAVHVHGRLRFIEDAAFLDTHLERLTTRFEHGRDPAWAMRDAPAAFIAQQQRAIVGLVVEITRLEGKWKMSQNRSGADIDGVIRGLSGAPDAAQHDVARIVAARRPPDR